MPKTLIGAKPELKQGLYDSLKHASYEAYMTANSPSGADPVISSYVLKTTKQAATKFSECFAEIASTEISEVIYKYIKEMGIQLSPIGLSAPNGPVTGTTGPNTFTII